MTLRPFVLLAALLVATAAGAAELMGINNEKEAQLRGRVVDVACELTKDCPVNCGAGSRQLGLRTADGKLVFIAKSNVYFAGAVNDLLPYCGREITVDGVFTTSDDLTMFMAQGIKPAGAPAFKPTTKFQEDWARKNNLKVDSDQANEWWRNDPTVKQVIAKDGKLGLPE